MAFSLSCLLLVVFGNEIRSNHPRPAPHGRGDDRDVQPSAGDRAMQAFSNPLKIKINNKSTEATPIIH
jgi:hypothetical protein